MKVLLAEDDIRLGKMIHQMLQQQAIHTDWVQTGDSAWNFGYADEYEVIILDWMLPGKSGMQVCCELRETGYQGSILLLTAKDSVEDMITALESGADDYLVKPFDFRELFARLRALARRSSRTIAQEVIMIADLELNRTTKTVRRGTRLIQLTAKEFQLLDILMQNYGRVLPKDTIMDRMWGLGSDVSPNNLEAWIRLLRKKVEGPEEIKLIHNVRSIGYKIEAIR